MALDPGFISTVPGTISTQGMGSASPGGGLDTSFFSVMAQRKLARQAALDAQQAQEHDLQMALERERLKAAHEANIRHDASGTAGPDAQARYMGQRAAIIGADEASRPAPLVYRPATPGTTGGWQKDINAMDAHQRDMFLPSGSSFQGPGPHMTSAADDLNQDELLDSLKRTSNAYAGPDWYGSKGRV